MIKTVGVKAGIRLAIISLSILTGCDAKGAEPKAYKTLVISDIETHTDFFSTDMTSGIPLRYSLSYQKTNESIGLRSYHSNTMVKNVVRNSSNALYTFLKSKGLELKDCRGSSYNLNIFVIKKSLLQERERFRSFFHSHREGSVLYGYYDSTKEIRNNSTVIVANIKESLNEEILAHELAHYWWDRLCIASYSRETSEDFARSFQNYYRKMYTNYE